jgi:alpha-glucosidase
MLAGPMDFHQGSLRTVSLEKFRPQDAAPLVIGTPCRVLATYVIFQNPLPMMADYRSAYRQHPLTKLIVKVPDTWDDTVALAGEVGKFIAVARRKDSDWWIGVMTNREARELTLPLDYLNAGRYRATIYQDDVSVERGFSETAIEVASRATQIPVSLASAGGAIIHLSPARK